MCRTQQESESRQPWNNSTNNSTARLRVRATSDCICPNTRWIPQIHKRLAARTEIKAWKHSCVLASPVRAPKDINHGFRGGWSAGSFMLQSDQKKNATVFCHAEYSAHLGSIFKHKFNVFPLVKNIKDFGALVHFIIMSEGQHVHFVHKRWSSKTYCRSTVLLLTLLSM